ncbi:aldehyde dehydrogenase family protein [Vreelandella janggokensis]|uniref:aldehyde dehydrogenase family protein n=1 Tax=Vreelandella janggokensis TaxID=370767 RepID=UPI002864BEDE|nr:aldehyde dehydrogenase family protein [Halomonas janggokensis]MDR5884567.1 aldehyde dehydrogenase family protein [Halomonas janggokensis]
MTCHLNACLETQRLACRQSPYPTRAERRELLARLALMTRRHRHAIIEAIQTDFGQRSEVEIQLADIQPVLDAVSHARRHLWHWMRPWRVSVPWRLLPARARIAPQPLGVVGIIAPWNYPWSLALMPVVDALAAGNRVMLKPSELTPHTSALLGRLVTQYFSPRTLCVIEGDATTGQAFSALPFDHLLFTGSPQVGRKVALAAANNLTPTTLELGGKSPAFVAGDADFTRAADAIIFGKGMNAGQTCIAPDYVLVESRHIDALTNALSRAILKQRPSAREATQPINEAQRARSEAMLAEARNHGCRIIDHGAHAPALVIDPHQRLAVMREEIFGRCLPVISVKDSNKALDFVAARPHPLAIYVFTQQRDQQRHWQHASQSGALVFNTTLLHHAVPGLPFGGVGASGHGAYHGRHGFHRFSHLRGMFYLASRSPATQLYPPYRRWLLKLLRLI